MPASAGAGSKASGVASENSLAPGLSIRIWVFPGNQNPATQLILSSQVNGGGTIYFNHGPVLYGTTDLGGSISWACSLS
jgi:hypothetical protein